ncbi:hypothetical protein RJG79_00890 [Mycoplasmatota bacterium WC44]
MNDRKFTFAFIAVVVQSLVFVQMIRLFSMLSISGWELLWAAIILIFTWIAIFKAERRKVWAYALLIFGFYSVVVAALNFSLIGILIAITYIVYGYSWVK